MIYHVECRRWGRFFSVPCSVADEYMKLSDGNFVKALLCLLCSDSDIADPGDIASRAGITVQQAEDALLYWADKGIITLSSAEGSEVRTSVHIQPAPVMQPVQSESAGSAKAVVRYSPKDLSDKIDSSEDLQRLTQDVQQILGRTINASETACLINLYEYYGFSVAAVLMICEYCYKLGKDRVSYIERVAKDWFERGIISYSQVEAEIIEQSKRHSYSNKAVKAFGLNGKLSKKQQEYIEQWRTMGFSIDMLEIAYDKCMDAKNELKFSYIDGILKSWAGKQIATPEQVSDDDKRYYDTRKKKESRTANKDTSYDLDEWERFAMNFMPASGGDGE